MKAIIEIEKVSNGYIITSKHNGFKKIAANAEDTAKLVAFELSLVFEEVKDGEIKTLEFELK